MSISDNNSINIISSNIDIAQNEYVTKYSFNRNFEKLISNDVILDHQSHDDLTIETYNKYKTYNRDDLVFYKIKQTDSQLYVLCSLISPNQHKPRVRKDINTNELYVISSEYWGIVGGVDYADTQMAIKDIANLYITNNCKNFIDNHQDNLVLDCHPSGKLAMDDSNILFRTFENISENKSHLYYPYELRSFVANNSIYSGYMRKWDSGILEYDIIFKLGYTGKTDDQIDLISANTYHAIHNNNNFMYFQDDDDYGIFSQGGDYYININKTKQVNLNSFINAYSSKIEFIEPFKNLNYMIFSSNVKNVETEAYNNKISIIKNYDDRLIINNRTIIGLNENSLFIKPLNIPNQIINIKQYSLDNIKKTLDYDVVINIDPYNSQLINIDDSAFIQSEINTISLPYSLRYIGSNAFANCNQLTSLILYVERDPLLQPKIDYFAFNYTDIKEISVIYKQDSSTLFGTPNQLNENYQQIYLSEQHISEKLQDRNYRTNIGITGDPKIYVENAPIRQQPTVLMLKSIHQNINETDQQELINTESENSTIITINVDEFLAELSAINALKSNKSLLFKSNTPIVPTINNIFNFTILSDGKKAISGYNDNIILDDEIKIDLNSDNTITQILPGALEGFDKLTSLSIGSNITSIAPDAFGYTFNELVLSNDNSFIFDDTQFDTICVLNSNCKLSVDNVNNYYYVQNNAIIPAQSISASYIKNLYVNNVKELQTSAFINVNDIDNVYLVSNNRDAVICSNAFYSEFVEELDDEGNIIDSFYEINFNNLELSGYSWTFQPSALMGIEVDQLNINMLSSQISYNAFYNGYIATLILTNNLSANTNNEFRGLYAQALSTCYIANLVFPDVDVNISNLSTIIRTPESNTTTIQALKNIECSQPTIITTSSDSQIFFENKLNVVIDYLEINDDNTALNKINNNIQSEKYDGLVLIPNYIQTINSNIANNLTVINNVREIYIPKSIKHINDNAFAGLSNLTNIIFEQGIQLDYIGKNIFKDCTSLEDVIIP